MRDLYVVLLTSNHWDAILVLLSIKGRFRWSLRAEISDRSINIVFHEFAPFIFTHLLVELHQLGLVGLYSGEMMKVDTSMQSQTKNVNIQERTVLWNT